jgi:hypothetical protein
MTGPRVSALCIAAILLLPPVTSAQDLSKYREYQLGMSLAAVATQAGMSPSDARVLHQRPMLIEELEWRLGDVSGPSARPESVRRIFFSFHEGQLFRIAVSYFWDRTEGLTVDDLVDAVSATYGLATLPVTDIVLPASRVATNGDRVLAHWEDSQYSLDLLRPSFAPTFGLILFSKRLEALARAADAHATLEVEVIEVEVIPDEEAIRPVQLEGLTRRLNKALFRP